MGKHEKRNQYHPPFCAALELELCRDKGHLRYVKEYSLNTKPNQIDLLVVRTDKKTSMQSGLGNIFRTYNLVEYKSPLSGLDVHTYMRSEGYAWLFAAFGDRQISMDEITLTFIRDGKPKKLLRYLQQDGFHIEVYEPGIYHIRKMGHMDMQVVVARELGRRYPWITKLTDRVEWSDIEGMAEEINRLPDEHERMNAESVMDFIFQLNYEKRWVKEAYGMGACRDLFKKEFEEKDRKIAELSSRLKDRDERLKDQDEQLKDRDEQLKDQSEQLKDQKKLLQSKNEENLKLKEEIMQLKKQLGQIAML